MSAKIMSICLIVGIISPLSTFPLRLMGVEKKVTRHAADNRDLILCWIVQIMTNVKCTCVPKKDGGTTADDDKLSNDASRNSSSGRHEFQQQSDCSCETAQIKKHISALSEELGLHILHKFGQFHDHFLLCHLDIDDSDTTVQKNLASAQSTSHTISQIHRVHGNLKSQDQLLFDKYKENIENCLRYHDEIVWFTSEYVHRHHSRSINPPQINDLNLQNEDIPLSHHTRISDMEDKHHSIILKTDNIHNPAFSTSSKILSEAVVETTKSVIKPLQSGNNSTVSDNSDRNHVFHFHNTTQVLHFLNSPTSTGLNKHNLFHPSLHSISRRSLDIKFNDPEYPRQWHLKNTLTAGMDINVTGVWMHNLTGRGVTVAVVDDGLQWMNPDLADNYNYKGSWDMNDDDPDPTPSSSKLENHHGTRCAGEIAAVANNHFCGVGAAYGAQISGLRVLDGVMTDSMEAEAFNKNMDINDIYSCSWGPEDDGRTVDGPHLMAAKAMKYGIDFGRRGYGSIFVLASGNGGEHHDNCNFDGYANSIYTVTIGAVDDNGGMPYYAEECASMLGVTFSSGTTNKRNIVTTDWTLKNADGCTYSHTGTSAAAPLAAAMIALMLQARPCLTWRDVQYILILMGQKVDAASAHFQKNGAGLFHSHKHGFGLLNSWRLVNAARVWEMVPWLTSFSYAESDVSLIIGKGKDNYLKFGHVVSEEDIRGLSLFILENVQLTITLSHPSRGKIGVNLTSPSGTVSVLAAPRSKDNSSDGFNDWTFTSVRCWGEAPTGNWTFYVIDHDDDHLFGKGKVTKWRLTLFGTPMTGEEFQERRKRVESALSGDLLQTDPRPCPPAPKYESASIPMSDRTLKILILVGAFCFVMAVYETFEYILCYNDEKKETARNRCITQQIHNLGHVTRGSNNGGPEYSSLLDRDTPCASSNSVNDSVLNANDEEDDVFDMSETSRLLTGECSCSSGASATVMPEEIALSTFHVDRTDISDGTHLSTFHVDRTDISDGTHLSTFHVDRTDISDGTHLSTFHVDRTDISDGTHLSTFHVDRTDISDGTHLSTFHVDRTDISDGTHLSTFHVDRTDISDGTHLSTFHVDRTDISDGTHLSTFHVDRTDISDGTHLSTFHVDRTDICDGTPERANGTSPITCSVKAS